MEKQRLCRMWTHSSTWSGVNKNLLQVTECYILYVFAFLMGVMLYRNMFPSNLVEACFRTVRSINFCPYFLFSHLLYCHKLLTFACPLFLFSTKQFMSLRGIIRMSWIRLQSVRFLPFFIRIGINNSLLVWHYCIFGQYQKQQPQMAWIFWVCWSSPLPLVSSWATWSQKENPSEISLPVWMKP